MAVKRIKNFLKIFLFGVLLVFSSTGLAVTETASEEADKVIELDQERIKEASKLVEEIEGYAIEARHQFAILIKAKGEERSLAGVQILEIERQIRRLLDELITELEDMRDSGYDIDAYLSVARSSTKEQAQSLIAEIRYVNKVMADIRPQRDEVAPEDLFELEQRLNRGRRIVDQFYQALLDNSKRKQRIGLDASKDLAYLKTGLITHAESVAARVKLSMRQIETLEQRLEEAGENQKLELEVELRALNEKKSGTTSSLQTLVVLMKYFELKTTEYSQLLVRATGTISEQTLNKEVVAGLFEQWMYDVKQWVIDSTPGFIVKVLSLALILATFKLMSILLGGLVRKGIATSKISISLLLQDFFVSVTRKLVMISGFLICLSQIGLQIGPLLAGLGVAGFIIGFALQETLANFASGMMILIYRPFDVDDIIETSGMRGTVKEMSLVATTMLTFNNEKLIIPNKKIWGDVIRNITSETIRRIDFVFPVGHDADIEQTEKLLRSIVQAHELILSDPEPLIHLHQIDESSVKIIVRPWVNNKDYWPVYWDVMRTVKLRLEAEGIAKPFPQYDLNLRQHVQVTD